MEQTGHQLAKKFTMTGLPTRSLDEKGRPSSVCDSKLGRGRPRRSSETDGRSAAPARSTVGPRASVPTTSRARQRRRRVSVVLLTAVPLERNARSPPSASSLPHDALEGEPDQASGDDDEWFRDLLHVAEDEQRRQGDGDGGQVDQGAPPEYEGRTRDCSGRGS